MIIEKMIDMIENRMRTDVENLEEKAEKGWDDLEQIYEEVEVISNVLQDPLPPFAHVEIFEQDLRFFQNLLRVKNYLPEKELRKFNRTYQKENFYEDPQSKIVNIDGHELILSAFSTENWVNSQIAEEIFTEEGAELSEFFSHSENFKETVHFDTNEKINSYNDKKIKTEKSKPVSDCYELETKKAELLSINPNLEFEHFNVSRSPKISKKTKKNKKQAVAWDNLKIALVNL